MQMIHKGYTGSVEYSKADKCYFGKVLGIPDLVSYEGKNLIELSKDFREAVEGYIELKNRL